MHGWLASPTTDANLGEVRETLRDREAWRAWGRKEPGMTYDSTAAGTKVGLEEAAPGM